jgi:vitamin B12 transporter
MAHANATTPVLDTVIQYHDVIIKGQANPASDLSKYLPLDLNDKSTTGKRLSEVLEESSALNVKSYGIGQLSTISLQGASAAQTLITWNGIAINSPANGLIDLSLLDFSGVNSIRIRNTGERGLVGGAIDLSPAPSTDRFNSTQLVRVGSFGLFNLVSSNAYRAGIFAGSTRIGYLQATNDYAYRHDMGHTVLQPHAATSQLSVAQQLDFALTKHINWTTDVWLTTASRDIPPTMTQIQSRASQSDQSYRAMTALKWSRGKYSLSAKSALIADDIH